MYVFTELMLRYVSAAISALLLPWVMSAMISDSRSDSPSLRPGQSRPTVSLAVPGGSLTTISPWWIASSASTSWAAGSVLDRYPQAPFFSARSISDCWKLHVYTATRLAWGLSTSTSRSSRSASPWANVSYRAMSTSTVTGSSGAICTIWTRSAYWSNMWARPTSTTS